MALEPAGCFVAELDGQAVGTTTTCCFGPIAWIAMVLVDESARRRGAGRRQMQLAVAHLQAAGMCSIRLDATSMGQPVYEKVGFTCDFGLIRFAGVVRTSRPNEAADVMPIRAEHVDGMAAIDEHVTSTPRGQFVRSLYEAWPEVFFCRVDDRGRLLGCGGVDGSDAIVRLCDPHCTTMGMTMVGMACRRWSRAYF